MRITLVQVEIQTAIVDYIHKQVNLKPNQEISIEFIASRGEDGYQAMIDIAPAKDGGEMGTTEVVAEPKKVGIPTPAAATDVVIEFTVSKNNVPVDGTEATEATEVVEEKPKRRGRPKGSTNKLKTDEEAAAEKDAEDLNQEAEEGGAEVNVIDNTDDLSGDNGPADIGDAPQEVVNEVVEEAPVAPKKSLFGNAPKKKSQAPAENVKDENVEGVETEQPKKTLSIFGGMQRPTNS